MELYLSFLPTLLPFFIALHFAMYFIAENRRTDKGSDDIAVLGVFAIILAVILTLVCIGCLMADKTGSAFLIGRLSMGLVLAHLAIHLFSKEKKEKVTE